MALPEQRELNIDEMNIYNFINPRKAQLNTLIKHNIL